VIPYGIAVPVLLGAVVVLTVLLVVTLESWHSALSDAVALGSHPQDIPQSDLIKVAAMVFLLGATALAAVYILEYYRRTQRQLNRVQQLSRNILENIVTGVITLAADGSVSMANPAAHTMLGLPSEVTGLDTGWFEQRHPALARLLRSALDGDFVQDTDVSSRKPDGKTIWLRGTTTPLPENERREAGVIALVKDVTELLSVEKQLRRLDRLAVTESLAAGVAHEIRNPLTAIDLNLRLLQSEVSSPSPDPGEVQTQFEILTEETRRLNRITEQFLTFSRRQTAPHRAISVVEVVRRVRQLVVSEATDKNIRIETFLNPSSGHVLGDPEHLEQVLLNILVNAMEAMPGGGAIQVAVAPSSSGGTEWVEIRISDQGPGVDEKHLSRLFDPYFTTKPSGNGLGLAIAHRITTDHDGEIGIENRPGGGALAWVRLPAVPAPAGKTTE